MPEHSWSCPSCKTKNPAFTEVCRDCGTSADPSNLSFNHCQSPQINRGDDIPEDPPWFSNHPIAAGTLVFLFIVPFLLNFFPSSPVASPGFVAFIFALGLPPVIQSIVGFCSIFGTAFFRLGARDKAITISLGALIALPSFGGVALVYVFVAELHSQLTCSGGACAQGGMGTMLFVVISWAGGIIACGMSYLFSRWKWWPLSLNPSFGWGD